MRRLFVIMAALFGVLLATGGSAQASPLPNGCKTTSPTIAKATQNGVVGILVTAPPVTCSAASGYRFLAVTIGAQIAYDSPTGMLTYHNVQYRESGVTSLPASFFVPWQGAQPGGTPVQGYRGRVAYALSGPTGGINVTHFTGNLWWS